MNVLNDIKDNIQSLNLNHLMVQAVKEASTEEKLKACSKHQYSKDCIEGGYEFLDNSNSEEWFYMWELVWNNFEWQALLGPYLIAGSLYSAWIVLLLPNSKPTI